jgi:hypothetical protein
VRGIVPVTVRVTDTVTSATSPVVTVGANGSFTAIVTALPGHPLTITATDAAGRTNTRSLGGTYGATSTALANQSVVDVNFRARRVSTNGTVTLTTGGSIWNSGVPATSKLLVYRTPDLSTTPQIITTGNGAVYDAVISGGTIYMSGDRFGTINLSDATNTTHLANDQPGSEGAIAVAGGYAFSAELAYYNDGRIHIYNVGNPDAPVYSRTQAMGPGGFSYRSLVPMGTGYLIGLSPDRPGSVDHDVAIIDRTNINSLSRIAELGIPNFDAVDGVIDGTTLYVVGADGGVAIVDLTNPFTPQLKAVLDTPGIARGVAVSGPNEIVVADAGGPALTFVDVTDKAHPVVTGTQRLAGNAIDVDVSAKTIWVAADSYLHAIVRP